MSNNAPTLKVGRLTAHEMIYIKQGIAEGKAPSDIARDLNRSVDAVMNFVAPEKPTYADEFIELETSPEFKLLSSEFSVDELNYFKHRYVKFLIQFKKDILPTEETQVYLLIKLEIMMNRNLRGAKRSLQDIARLERQLKAIYDKYEDFNDALDSDKASALSLESQLLTSKTAHQAKSNEFIKLQEKHSSLLKELKATREQRTKNMQEQQHTFLGLLKQFQDERWRKNEGRVMAMAQEAGKRSYKKLGSQHNYPDETVDRPILSPDTINLEE